MNKSLVSKNKSKTKYALIVFKFVLNFLASFIIFIIIIFLHDSVYSVFQLYVHARYVYMNVRTYVHTV